METPTLTEETALIITHAMLADAFIRKFAGKFAERPSIWVSTSCVRITFRASYLNEQNRDRLLNHVGEIFGRNGWTATPEFDGKSYRWTLPVDGVSVDIEGAQTLPPLAAHKVDAKQFPILLQDVA